MKSLLYYDPGFRINDAARKLAFDLMDRAPGAPESVRDFATETLARSPIVVLCASRAFITDQRIDLDDDPAFEAFARDHLLHTIQFLDDRNNKDRYQ